MNKYISHKTQNTPHVEFNDSTHRLNIIGSSTSSEANSFYSPLIQWLKEYSCLIYYLQNFKKAPIKIDVYLELVDHNLLAVKCIYKMLLVLKEISDYSNVIVQITWAYNAKNKDTYDSGKTLQEMTGLNFNIIVSRNTPINPKVEFQKQ